MASPKRSAPDGEGQLPLAASPWLGTRPWGKPGEDLAEGSLGKHTKNMAKL